MKNGMTTADATNYIIAAGGLAFLVVFILSQLQIPTRPQRRYYRRLRDKTGWLKLAINEINGVDYEDDNRHEHEQ